MTNRVKHLVKRFTVYPWQRVRRGYSDADLWSLDAYLARILAPALRDLSRKPAYVPLNAEYAFDDAADETYWTQLLNEMADGFEAMNDIMTYSDEEEHWEKIDRAYALLAQWHRYLWW